MNPNECFGLKDTVRARRPLRSTASRLRFGIVKKRILLVVQTDVAGVLTRDRGKCSAVARQSGSRPVRLFRDSHSDL